MRFLVMVALFLGRVFATELENTVSKMTAGSFRPLVTQGLTGDMIKTGPVSDVIFAFSDNASWDPVSGQLLFLGCPHYAPWRFIVYKDSSNFWRNESLPNPVMAQGGSVYIGHAYDHNTVDTKRGHYYTFNAQGHMYRFKTGINQWETISQNGTKPRTGFGMAFDYFPDIDKIVHVFGGSVALFDIRTLTWSSLRSGVTMGDYHNMMEYDPVRHLMVFGGGNGNSTLNRMDTLLNVTQLAPPPVTIGIPGTIMTADPVTGKMLIMSQQKFYAFDALADSWELLSSDITTLPGLKTFNTSAAVATPISTYGVNAFISNYSYPVLLYRYSPPVAVETGVPQGGLSGKLFGSSNPLRQGSVIRCQISGARQIRLSAFDLKGRLLASTVISGETGEWSAGELSGYRGVCLVRAETDASLVLSARLVVMP